MEKIKKFGLRKIAGVLASVAIGFLFLGEEVNAQEAETSAIPKVEAVETAEVVPVTESSLVEVPATEITAVDNAMVVEVQPTITEIQPAATTVTSEESAPVENTQPAEAVTAAQPEVVMAAEAATEPINVTNIILGGSFTGDTTKTEDFYYYDVEFDVAPNISGGETKTFTLSEGFKISGPKTATLDLVHESGVKFADVTFTPETRTAVLRLDNVRGGFRISFSKLEPADSEIGDTFKISLSVDGQVVPSSEKSLEYIGYGREIKPHNVYKTVYHGNSDPGIFWNVIYLNQSGNLPMNNIVLIDDIDPMSEDNVSYLRDTISVQIVSWKQDPKRGLKMTTLETITKDVTIDWSEYGKFTMRLPEKANGKAITISYNTKYDSPVEEGERIINKLTVMADGVEETRTARASVNKLSGYIVGDPTKGSAVVNFLSDSGTVIKNRIVDTDKGPVDSTYNVGEHVPQVIEFEGFNYEFIKFARNLNDPAVRDSGLFTRVDPSEGLIEGRTTKQVVAIYEKVVGGVSAFWINEEGTTIKPPQSMDDQKPGEDYQVPVPEEIEYEGTTYVFNRVAETPDDQSVVATQQIDRTDPVSGKIEGKNQKVVVVVYNRKPDTHKIGSVVVDYIDEDGNKIADQVIDSDNLVAGERYDTADHHRETIEFQGNKYTWNRTAIVLDDPAVTANGSFTRIDGPSGDIEAGVTKQIVYIFVKMETAVPGDFPTTELPEGELPPEKAILGDFPTTELPEGSVTVEPKPQKPKGEEKPSPTPKNEPKQQAALPNTGDTGSISVVLGVALTAGGAIIARRKRK